MKKLRLLTTVLLVTAMLAGCGTADLPVVIVPETPESSSTQESSSQVIVESSSTQPSQTVESTEKTEEVAAGAA